MRILVMAGLALALPGLPPAALSADEKIDALIKDLNSNGKAKRLDAIRGLGNLGSAAKETIPLLAEQMRHKDADQANQAARALAQIGSAAVPEVIKALDDPTPAVRDRALLALGTMGREAGKAAVPVSGLLKHEDPKVRWLAALALGAMHEEARPVAAALEAALQDPNPQVRFVVGDSLFQIGPEAIPHLLAVLKSTEPAVRGNALSTLGRFSKSDKALQALVEGLKDPHGGVRAVAADALIRLGPLARTALPSLLECLKDEDGEVQIRGFTAIMAIRAVDDTAVRDTLTALNEQGRWARDDVANWNVPQAVLMLKSLAASQRPTQRLAAALGMARLGPAGKDALAVLKSLASDRDHSVRAGALVALTVVDPTRGAVDYDKIADLLQASMQRYRGSSDLGDIVRIHMVLSTLPVSKGSGAGPGEDAKKRLDDCRRDALKILDDCSVSFDDLAPLLEGMNMTAQWNLGFTEPFNRLAFKTRQVIAEAKDAKMAIFLLDHLGSGVPPMSVYWPAMQQQWAQSLSKVPVDGLIWQQQQLLLWQKQRTMVMQTQRMAIDNLLMGFS